MRCARGCAWRGVGSVTILKSAHALFTAEPFSRPPLSPFFFMPVHIGSSLRPSHRANVAARRSAPPCGWPCSHGQNVQRARPHSSILRRPLDDDRSPSRSPSPSRSRSPRRSRSPPHSARGMAAGRGHTRTSKHTSTHTHQATYLPSIPHSQNAPVVARSCSIGPHDTVVSFRDARNTPSCECHLARPR